MIHSAFELFREFGVSGTGLRDINAHSGVARGAIYHHFPGGKDELAAAAASYAGDQIRALLETVAVTADPVTTVRAFVAAWEDHVIAHEFRAGCTIVAVANEAASGSTVAEAASQAFDGWVSVLATCLQREGISRERAERLGSMIVSSVEGAVILSRVRGTTGPLKDVGYELETILAGVLHR
jgi:AcrR family transcriptional regulator